MTYVAYGLGHGVWDERRALLGTKSPFSHAWYKLSFILPDLTLTHDHFSLVKL